MPSDRIIESKWPEYANAILLCLSVVMLIGLQIQWGWIMFILGAVELVLCSRHFRKDIVLLYVSIILLAITSITTDLSYGHILAMATTLFLAIAIPYAISRFVYKDRLIQFRFHHGRSWFKTEILYIFLTVIFSYVLLPFYLKSTGAYLNWTVQMEFSYITRLFISTNALGIWDELFFVSTALGILRRFFPFSFANIVQSVFFTSFLYELGFTEWGCVMIFLFAVVQGYIFAKTDSLFYVITIHLSLDFILFLALIEAHHPASLPIFLY